MLQVFLNIFYTVLKSRAGSFGGFYGLNRQFCGVLLGLGRVM